MRVGQSTYASVHLVEKVEDEIMQRAKGDVPSDDHVLLAYPREDHRPPVSRVGPHCLCKSYELRTARDVLVPRGHVHVHVVMCMCMYELRTARDVLVPRGQPVRQWGASARPRPPVLTRAAP